MVRGGVNGENILWHGIGTYNDSCGFGCVSFMVNRGIGLI